MWPSLSKSRVLLNWWRILPQLRGFGGGEGWMGVYFSGPWSTQQSYAFEKSWWVAAIPGCLLSYWGFWEVSVSKQGLNFWWLYIVNMLRRFWNFYFISLFSKFDFQTTLVHNRWGPLLRDQCLSVIFCKYISKMK